MINWSPKSAVWFMTSPTTNTKRPSPPQNPWSKTVKLSYPFQLNSFKSKLAKFPSDSLMSENPFGKINNRTKFLSIRALIVKLLQHRTIQWMTQHPLDFRQWESKHSRLIHLAAIDKAFLTISPEHNIQRHLWCRCFWTISERYHNFSTTRRWRTNGLWHRKWIPKLGPGESQSFTLSKVDDRKLHSKGEAS